jgi:hypothetical protein
MSQTHNGKEMEELARPKRPWRPWDDEVSTPSIAPPDTEEDNENPFDDTAEWTVVDETVPGEDDFFAQVDAAVKEAITTVANEAASATTTIVGAAATTIDEEKFIPAAIIVEIPDETAALIAAVETAEATIVEAAAYEGPAEVDIRDFWEPYDNSIATEESATAIASCELPASVTDEEPQQEAEEGPFDVSWLVVDEADPVNEDFFAKAAAGVKEATTEPSEALSNESEEEPTPGTQAVAMAEKLLKAQCSISPGKKSVGMLEKMYNNKSSSSNSSWKSRLVKGTGHSPG